MNLITTTRRSRLKNAILASFREPTPEVSLLFGGFTERDWRSVLRWLDISGLALYFLDRLSSIGAEGYLPTPILARLQQNLSDNRERTSALFQETVAIAGALKQRRISFAVLKGITLAPESVCDISLRCQMDIDILIRSSDAFATRDILQEFGYMLTSVKGREWAFTTGGDRPMGMGSLYKVRPQKMVEVHLLAGKGKRSAALLDDRLSRARPRFFQGFELPALSPPDLFVQQALHIFTHLCSEHTRAHWMLEYWRHIQARQRDVAFWKNVESVAANEPQADVAIGAVTLLATLLFGEVAPPELTRWSLERLPLGVRLWIETYGRRVLVNDFPASKFYMLLRQQLKTDRRQDRAPWWRFLLPFHLWPARITHAPTGERLPARLYRYQSEGEHALRRLRFHLRTCIPYAMESLRWQRLIEKSR